MIRRWILQAAVCLISLPALAAAETSAFHMDRGLEAIARGGPVPLRGRPILDGHHTSTPLRPFNALREYVAPEEFGVMLEFDGTRQELEARGIRVGTQVGHMFTARMRAGEIGRLRGIAGLRRAELSRYMQPLLDVSVVDIRAFDEQIRVAGNPGVYNGRAGQGVLVGLVDTGIDFTLIDFKDRYGKTRIQRIWDQTDLPGPHPPGFSYGSEWTNTQIDASPGSVRERDTDGHGTMVAGIMAASGIATGCSQQSYRYVGVAPLAGIVVVKTDFTDSGIVDGVNYCFQRAAAIGRDCVVNLSLGAQSGAHDGSDDMTLMINGLTGPGRIVVAAAGNSAADDGHGQLVTTSTTPGVDHMTVDVPPYTAKPGAFNDYFLVAGWYKDAGGPHFTIRVRGPTSGDTLSAGVGQVRERNSTSGKIYIAHQSSQAGIGGTPTSKQFEVEVYDSLANRAPLAGGWSIDIVPDGPADVGQRCDIWVYASWLGDFSGASVSTGLDGNTLVAEPADGDSIIAVGAYVTRSGWTSCAQGGCGYSGTTVGGLAIFSSPGPRRDGVLKPEICAPGMGIASIHSTQAPAIQFCGDSDDGLHEINAGTSFSSPHMAGAAALFLQYAPGASPSAVRQAFETHARHVAPVPNNGWGYGKIDVFGSIAHTAPVAGITAPFGGETWPSGSSQTLRWTASGPNPLTSIDLDYSLHGSGGPWAEILHNAPNTGSYAWTLPAEVADSAVVRIVAYSTQNSTAYSGRFRIGPSGSDQPVAELSLAPIYPNPTSVDVPIRFTMPTTGKASVQIVGIDGRQIWKQEIDAAAPGPYTVTWKGQTDRGDPAPSGIYFVNVRTGSKQKSGRIAFIK